MFPEGSVIFFPGLPKLKEKKHFHSNLSGGKKRLVQASHPFLHPPGVQTRMSDDTPSPVLPYPVLHCRSRSASPDAFTDLEIVLVYDEENAVESTRSNDALSFLHETAELLSVNKGEYPKGIDEKAVLTKETVVVYVFMFTEYSLARAMHSSKRGGKELWALFLSLTDEESRKALASCSLLKRLIEEDDVYKNADTSSIVRQFNAAGSTTYTICSKDLSLGAYLLERDFIRQNEEGVSECTLPSLPSPDHWGATLYIPTGAKATHESSESWIKELKTAVFEDLGIYITDELDLATSISNTAKQEEQEQESTRPTGLPVIPGMKEFRPNCTRLPRDYQNLAVSKILTGLGSRLRSGIITAPCGSGKTLMGIMTMQAHGTPVLLFCSSTLALHQWQDHICSTLKLRKVDDVFTMTSANMQNRSPGVDYGEGNFAPCVVITTYNMFAGSIHGASHFRKQQSDGAGDQDFAADSDALAPSGSGFVNRSKSTLAWMNYCKQKEWGAIILDEVHQAPADNFGKLVTGFKAHLKFGLTATLVREDDQIMQLDFLVGPVLYKIDTPTLRRQGYVSEVDCVEVVCGPDKLQESALASSMNPMVNMYKIEACAKLLAIHRTMGQKCLVFCDNLNALSLYSKISGFSLLQGSTPITKRRELIKHFRTCPGSEVLLLSKVGDQSIDIPEAAVVIQLSTPNGSRMQELQRAGRIQRTDASKLANSVDGRQVSIFYSLVSGWDASELSFARHRKTYLGKHGYSVRTIRSDSLPPHPEVDLVFKDPVKWKTCERALQQVMLQMAAEDIDGDELASGEPVGSKRKKRKAGPVSQDPPLLDQEQEGGGGGESEQLESQSTSQSKIIDYGPSKRTKVETGSVTRRDGKSEQTDNAKKLKEKEKNRTRFLSKLKSMTGK